jgi:hypothetical protein
MVRVSYILAQDQLLVDSGSAITWVGANKNYVETKSSVKTKDSVVSIASHGLITQLKRNLVHQNTTYSSGFFTGKLTSQEPIRYIHVLSQVLYTTIQLRFPTALLLLSSP